MKKLFLSIAALSSVCLTGCWGGYVDRDLGGESSTGNVNQYPTLRDFNTVKNHILRKKPDNYYGGFGDYGDYKEYSGDSGIQMTKNYAEEITLVDLAFTTSLFINEKHAMGPFFYTVSTFYKKDVHVYTNHLFLSLFNTKIAGSLFDHTKDMWVIYDVSVANYKFNSIKITEVQNEQGEPLSLGGKFVDSYAKKIRRSVKTDLMVTNYYFLKNNLPHIWSSDGKHNCEYKDSAE